MNPEQEREREMLNMLRNVQAAQPQVFYRGIGGNGGAGGNGGMGLADVFDLNAPPVRVNNNHNDIRMAEVEEVMKVRHLTKNERARYHQPKPDWRETPKGEVCKSSSTLEVEDIISKHS